MGRSRLSQDGPAPCGTYALFLRLENSYTIVVGALESLYFPAADYTYVGSAHGPGGLPARLGRHLRGDGKLRWHIDALRQRARVIGALYTLELPGVLQVGMRLECAWSQALSRQPGVFIPAAGFGASDCRAGCLAHLYGVPGGFTLERLAGIFGGEVRIITNP